jgi:hypothetical protein
MKVVKKDFLEKRSATLHTEMKTEDLLLARFNS